MVEFSNLPITGACICGAVEIEATQLPILTLACHCCDCQKLTSSAFSLTAIFPSKSFSVLSGNLVIGGKKSSERHHYFCGDCMSFVYTQIVGKTDRVNVRSNMFENASYLIPFVQIMTDEKRSWVNLQTPQAYPTFPQSDDEFMAIKSAYDIWLRQQV